MELVLTATPVDDLEASAFRLSPLGARLCTRVSFSHTEYGTLNMEKSAHTIAELALSPKLFSLALDASISMYPMHNSYPASTSNHFATFLCVIWDLKNPTDRM